MFGALERSLIVRSCIIWLFVRVLVAPAAAKTAGHPLFLAPSAAAIVIATTAAVAWLMTRRRFEDLMLANLGTPLWIVACLLALPPLVIEIVIAQAGAV